MNYKKLKIYWLKINFPFEPPPEPHDSILTLNIFLKETDEMERNIF